MGGLYFTPAMPMVAPTPSAGNTGSSAGVLTAGTTSDTGAWGLHVEYSTTNDRPTVTGRWPGLKRRHPHRRHCHRYRRTGGRDPWSSLPLLIGLPSPPVTVVGLKRRRPHRWHHDRYRRTGGRGGELHGEYATATNQLTATVARKIASTFQQKRVKSRRRRCLASRKLGGYLSGGFAAICMSNFPLIACDGNDLVARLYVRDFLVLLLGPFDLGF